MCHSLAKNVRKNLRYRLPAPVFSLKVEPAQTDSAIFTSSSKCRLFLKSHQVKRSTTVNEKLPPAAFGCPPPPNSRAIR